MRKKHLEPGYEAAKEKALRLLEFRAHSEWELRRKLADAGAAQEDIERVADFVREYHLVDDEAYAERLAADLANLKKFGKHRISAELSRRGIDREIIDNVLCGLETDEREALLPLMKKKLGGDFDRKSRDRAFRYFAARGYSFDDMKSTFEQARDESEDEGEYI